MARVRLTSDDQEPWIVSGQRAMSDAERGKLRQGELTSEYRLREPGGPQNPQLVELRYQPNAEIAVHSHDADEIVYILEGAMQINNRTLGPGGTLTITGGTFYGFRAGPEGLRILNFRPHEDASFHLPPSPR